MEKKNGRKNGRFFKITSLNLFFSSIFSGVPFFFTKRKVEEWPFPFFFGKPKNGRMEEWKSFQIYGTIPCTYNIAIYKLIRSYIIIYIRNRIYILAS